MMAQGLDEYRDVAPKGTVDFLHRLSESVSGRHFVFGEQPEREI